MQHNQMRQVVFPILAAFIWGTSFVSQDICADSMGAFTFNGTRYFIAVLSLLVVIAVMNTTRKDRPQPTAEEKKASRKQLWLGGLCCGSAVADAGGLGAIEMEAMKKNGYDEDFAGAVTAASSVIGPIFPPSIPLIIYGSVASVSVDQLFMGGVVPGLLMGVLLMVMVLYFAIVRRYERHPFRLRALIRQFLGSIPALITPVIILCGFVVGWFTPTEASSIAVIYSLLIALFLYRTLDWKSFKKCLKDSAISSANTLFIIGTSTLFTYVMAMEGISRQFADVILGISSNPNVVLLVINVLLLVLGMVMEPGAILTLMLPVLLPIANGLGLDLVHFGVMVVLNLMIGQVTPPFGVCLFVISDVNKLKLERLYRSILPFLVPLILTLILVTYIPGIVTALPNALLS